MRKIFTPIVMIVLLSQTSCMKLANRVAYGKAGNPVQTVSQTVNQANQAVSDVVQAKRAIDRYKKEATSQKRREKEDRYADMQQQETQKPTQPDTQQTAQPNELTLLKSSVEALSDRLAVMESINQQLNQERGKLERRIATLEAQTTSLKADNDARKQPLGEVAANQTQTDLTSLPVAVPVAKPAPTVTITEKSSLPGYIISVPSATPNVRHTTRTRRSYTPKSEQYYIRGPRGGCYYYTSSGRKEYVDRSLCN